MIFSQADLWLRASSRLVFSRLCRCESLARTTRHHAFCATGRWVKLTRGSACRRSVHTTSRSRFALLIDGDRIGPSYWSPMISKLRTLGDVVVSRVFVAPGQANSPRWQAALKSSGVEVVTVPRRGGGVKDPNDIAIALEAARFGFGGDINGIALAVTDVDFVYMAERLRSWGLRVVVLLQESQNLKLAAEFQEAQVEILRVSGASERGRPKFKAVLHSTGESSFESHSYEDSKMPYVEDEALIIKTLRLFGYMEKDTNPIVPAIAKFFHANNLGPLTVWPEMYPRVQAYDLFSSRRDESWRRSSQDLAFVSPRATKTPTDSTQERYGSVECGSVVNGGGPFILKDSSNLVTDALIRLGYLDSGYNSDVGEALHVFSSMGRNCSNLVSLGLDLRQTSDLDRKKALLRTALLSPETFGCWRVAPSDKLIRQKLASKKLISREAASQDEVFGAMQVYVRQLGLVHRKTYNGLLSEVLSRRSDQNPTKRRAANR